MDISNTLCLLSILLPYEYLSLLFVVCEMIHVHVDVEFDFRYTTYVS